MSQCLRVWKGPVHLVSSAPIYSKDLISASHVEVLQRDPPLLLGEINQGTSLHQRQKNGMDEGLMYASKLLRYLQRSLPWFESHCPKKNFSLNKNCKNWKFTYRVVEGMTCSR